jgi:hypothetical protein
MDRCILYVLLALSIFSSATLFTSAKGNPWTQQRPVGQAPTSSSNPLPDEVSARAADIPPPPLRASKINNSHVNYVPNSQVKKYPVPSVIFRREGLALPEDRSEIVEKIIYPAINKSDMPIAAIVVEFFRDRPEIGITLIWHASGVRGQSILQCFDKSKQDGPF